jgi:O-succinylbenzoate synthase
VSELRWHRVRLGGRPVVLVDGPCGWGEASPLPGYPCAPHAAVCAALEAATRPWPTPVREDVPVNALVSDAAFRPADIAGFACVKVKVGRVDPQRDLALVAAVRDAVGPRVALRVDANGAWDEDTAVSMIGRLSRFALELVEQPVRTIPAMARVRRRVRAPLAADECVRSLEDARLLHRLQAADAVVLKVQPLGGVGRARRIAEAAGVPAVVTSMMETSVGIAVALHLAASLDELPYACGLATAPQVGADVTDRPLVPERGRMRVRRVVPDLRRLTSALEGSGQRGGS